MPVVVLRYQGNVDPLPPPAQARGALETQDAPRRSRRRSRPAGDGDVLPPIAAATSGPVTGWETTGDGISKRKRSVRGEEAALTGPADATPNGWDDSPSGPKRRNKPRGDSDSLPPIAVAAPPAAVVAGWDGTDSPLRRRKPARGEETALARPADASPAGWEPGDRLQGTGRRKAKRSTDEALALGPLALLIGGWEGLDRAAGRRLPASKTNNEALLIPPVYPASGWESVANAIFPGRRTRLPDAELPFVAAIAPAGWELCEGLVVRRLQRRSRGEEWLAVVIAPAAAPGGWEESSPTPRRSKRATALPTDAQPWLLLRLLHEHFPLGGLVSRGGATGALARWAAEGLLVRGELGGGLVRGDLGGEIERGGATGTMARDG